MSTKSYVLVPYRLQDPNVQSSWKSFFPLCPTGTAVFWWPKKPFWGVSIEYFSLDSNEQVS
jgi:hypothetical protein